nr:MAG TPA: hypothetical protein [Caudoviricetes sp.]
MLTYTPCASTRQNYKHRPAIPESLRSTRGTDVGDAGIRP